MLPGLAAFAFIAAALAEPAPSLRALFFLTTDCPISNSYAPDIQRICSEYGSRGVRCELVYTDPGLSDEAMQKHAADFGYRGIPAVLDSQHKVSDSLGATVTPEVFVLDANRRVLYRGRIDDRYAAIGKRRRQATQTDLRDALGAALAGKNIRVPRTKAVGCAIAR